VFQIFGTASLDSPWYWALCILVWAHVCNRTLGVPHDMVLRAGRLPEVADRVDALAMIHAERIGAIHDRAGVLAAAAVGFAVAAVGVIGFVGDIEIAKAVFLLIFPLAVVGYSTLRLALGVRTRQSSGMMLRRSLRRRRIWHTAVAIAALMITASLAVMEHPSLVLR